MPRVHASPAALLLSIALFATASLGGCGDGSPESASASTRTFTVTYAVEGMHCDGCVTAITNKVKGVKGVTACEVSLDDHRAVVTLADPAISPAVEEAIKRLGYTVAKPSS